MLWPQLRGYRQITIFCLFTVFLPPHHSICMHLLHWLTSTLFVATLQELSSVKCCCVFSFVIVSHTNEEQSDYKGNKEVIHSVPFFILCGLSIVLVSWCRYFFCSVYCHHTVHSTAVLFSAFKWLCFGYTPLIQLYTWLKIHYIIR